MYILNPRLVGKIGVRECILYLLALSFSLPASANDIITLENQSLRVQQSYLDMRRTRKEFNTVMEEIELAKQKVSALNMQKSKLKRDYEKLVQISQQFANDAILDEAKSVGKKLRETEKIMQDENAKMDSKQQLLLLSKQKYDASKKEFDRVKAEEKTIFNRVANNLALRDEKQMIKERVVSIHIEEPCTLNLEACKENAKNKAYREAAERGSRIFVKSVTEINNFKLSSDIVKNEVSASVTSVKVLEDKPVVLPSNAFKWSYKIDATVAPRRSEAIFNELVLQHRRELEPYLFTPVDIEDNLTSHFSTSKNRRDATPKPLATSIPKSISEKQYIQISTSLEKQDYFSRNGAFESLDQIPVDLLDEGDGKKLMTHARDNFDQHISSLLRNEEFNKASREISQLQNFENSDISITWYTRLSSKLDKAEARANDRARDSEIEDLLDAGDSYLKRNRLFSNNGNDAYSMYTSVLDKSSGPAKDRANDGLSSIKSKRIQEIRYYMAKRNVSKAKSLLSEIENKPHYRGSSIWDSLNSELDTLRRKTKEKSKSNSRPAIGLF